MSNFTPELFHAQGVEWESVARILGFLAQSILAIRDVSSSSEVLGVGLQQPILDLA